LWIKNLETKIFKKKKKFLKKKLKDPIFFQGKFKPQKTYIKKKFLKNYYLYGPNS